MGELEEKTVGSRRIYEGRMINLRVDSVVLPDGRDANREVVEHPGAVAIVPLTAEGEIVFVRQYRQPIGIVTLEIPAGKLGKGEDPFQCAVRELEEETGLVAEKVELLADYFTTPGFSDERMYLYVATGLSKTQARPDEDEFLEVVHIPLEKAGRMAFGREIRDAKTLIGVMAAVIRRG